MKLRNLLGAAALAALVPVSIRTDRETGGASLRSLLWKLEVAPPRDGRGTRVSLDLMEGVLTAPILRAVAAREEARLFTDDPQEARPFPQPAGPAPAQDAPAATPSNTTEE